MKNQRGAIALLITVMFVIVITVAIGYGLKQVNIASDVVEDEKFIYQSSILVEDVLNMLKNSQDINKLLENNSSTEMYMFLSSASFIPLEIGGLEVLLKFSSARGRFNPNTLDNFNGINMQRVSAMKEYVSSKMINSEYVDILLDNMKILTQKNKYDSYNSAIFDKNPYLFRDYIASFEHLEKINDFYKKEYNSNDLKNIDFKKLFYFSQNRNMAIDLNYATPEVWEMLIGCSRSRAEDLSSNAGWYSSLNDLKLNDDEKALLSRFKTSFFEPYIYVDIEIVKQNSSSKIGFEYDIRTKKGSNFVYEI